MNTGGHISNNNNNNMKKKKKKNVNKDDKYNKKFTTFLLFRIIIKIQKFCDGSSFMHF